MFNETQYLIEKKRATLRPTYIIKDGSGNLVGYVKGQMLKPNYRFEDVNGTPLGEFRVVKDRYEVYDTADQLQATIRSSSGRRWKSSWRIEDATGQLLSEIEQTSNLFKEYQILATDRSVIAQIHQILKIPFLPGGATPSYRIDVSQQSLNPIVILSLFLL